MEVVIENISPHVEEAIESQFGITMEDGSLESTLCHLATGYVLYLVGGTLFYLFFASLSYYYYFVLFRDYYFPGKNDLPSDEDLRNQVRTEIGIALPSIPWMALLTVPFNLFSRLGYSWTYRRVDEYGYTYLVLSIFLFLAFADLTIYWIHRGLHTKLLYKILHKPHHTFRITTPFSSHAFHPVDGWLQSTPYLIFPFMMPMHNWLLLFLFIGVNTWTVSIHDRVPYYKGSFINSSNHHDVHHRDFFYNYGQYTTIMDKFGGTYKDPSPLLTDKSIKGNIKAGKNE